MSRFLHQLLLCIGVATAASASEPANKYNLPIQSRTRSCTPMVQDQVPLRFADGTPTGYFVKAADPSKQGGRVPCRVGDMEIDAHEVLTNADGAMLYFHPGGGGSHYTDARENGQYGHIFAADLKSLPVIKPNGNGKAAPLLQIGTGTTDYVITPTRIPHDMHYKANVVNGRSGSTYLTYGNPGYDKTEGKGDWTYINWSWVQNGGAKYPQNICRGGGMVRALGRRGDIFTACEVELIVGFSYGSDNQVNGRVTAFYGKTTAGKGGSPIYGWMPHSYQRTGDIIVPCVRRRDQGTVAVPATARTNEGLFARDPMERMALNLATEIKVEGGARANMLNDWLKSYRSEPRPFARMELITEMARLDEPETVRLLCSLLADEKDSRAREQMIVVLGFMGATEREIKNFSAAIVKDYKQNHDARERGRIEEIVGRFPGWTAEAITSQLKAEK